MSRIRHQLLGLLLLITAVCIGAPSGAAPAYEGWTVVDVKITGMPDNVGEDAAKGLGLASPSGFRRTGKVRFSESLLRADLRRLRLLLARSGYPYAQLEPVYSPRQGSYEVAVEFRVTPARPVRIGRVELQGAPAAGPPLDGELQARLTPGAIFTDAKVQQARDAVLARLLEAGYALATTSAEVARPDSFTAAVTVHVEPDEPYRFGAIRVDGVAEDLQRLALKTVDLHGGEGFSREAMNRARRNLRELQIFRQIKLNTERAEPGILDVQLDLKAADLRTARVSVGSWSDDPVRLRGQWRHRNYFSEGRGLGFDGAYSPHRQELGAGAWWPALMAPRSSNELTMRYRRDAEEAFHLETVTLETAAVLRPADRSALRLAAGVENVRVQILSDDPDVYSGNSGTQLVLTGRWHRDASDHLLYPTRGSRWTLDTALSPPGFLSRAPFASAELTGIFYFPAPGGSVVAARSAFGTAAPLGDATDLQPHRRFFAGGVSTMRGYGRRRLGPTDEQGDPIGGRARLLASLEWRVPLIGFLEAAAFSDAGQVWSQPENIRLGDVETALGGGLIFHTPIGPIRLDVARLVGEPRPGEPSTVFHVSVGHPF